MLGPSPTGAYILLRLRHARHCRPGARLHPRLPSQARGRQPPLQRPRDSSLSSPSSSARVRKRVARLPAYSPPPPPPRQPSRARSLSYRPSCRSCRPPKPTSLAADQPLRQRRLRQPLLPAGELRTRSTTAAATPASFSRRPSYAATAITFAGKSSEAVREPGLTLQGVVRGHGKPFFLVFYFFPLLFYFLFRSRGSREILSRNR